MRFDYDLMVISVWGSVGSGSDYDGQTQQLVTGNSNPPNNSSKFSDTGGGVLAAKTVNSTPDCKQHRLNVHSLAFDHWLLSFTILSDE